MLADPSAAHSSTGPPREPPRSLQRYLAGRRLGVSSALRVPCVPFLSRQLEVLGAIVKAGAVQPASNAARCIELDAGMAAGVGPMAGAAGARQRYLD